jgi:hypothetical protein
MIIVILPAMKMMSRFVISYHAMRNAKLKQMKAIDGGGRAWRGRISLGAQ